MDHIQSCGYLVAIEEGEGYPSGMGILCASANIAEAEWINATSCDEVAGKDLGQVFQPECVGALRSLVGRHKRARESSADRIPPNANRRTCTVDFTYHGRKAHAEGIRPEANKSSELVTFALAGSNPGVNLVEMELKRGPQSTRAVHSCEQLQLRHLLACIPPNSDTKSMASALCGTLVQRMPAYDRGMVYRFAPDRSGNIVCESRKGNNEMGSSYPDFEFPSADMSPEVRGLSKQVGLTFVADTHAPGVPIAFSSERGLTLDLSKCTLRAPSEYHLRYLRKMGVRASMAVAISVKGEVWGLFVLHSYKNPVHPSSEERNMVEIAAAITASLIERHEREGIPTGALSLLRTLEKLSNHSRLDDFLASEHRDLLQILDIDSILLCEHMRSVNVYGSKDVALTLEECKDLRSGKGDDADRDLHFKPLTAGGAAFFSVRSFLLVFLRGSAWMHAKWARVPEVEPWSPATVELLRLVRHGFLSQLRAEGLPADVEETFACAPHEPYTSFRGFVGALEILAAGSGSMDMDEQSETVGPSLRFDTSKMGTLDDIVDIANDLNNTEVAQAPFPALKPVLVAVAAMSSFAAGETVELTHDADTGVSDDPLPAVGDERSITAIVQNLVDNAINFTPRGGKVRAFLVVLDSWPDVVDWWTEETERFVDSVWMGSLESDSVVKNSESLRAPKWHVYCVEDSGIGILPADLPHLVTAYKQVSHGPAKPHPGAGLKLHICRAHVAAMSGALGIASTFSEEANPGGTLFAVVLPLGPAQPTSTAQAEDAAMLVGVRGGTKGALGAGASTRGPDIGSRKIAFLVVDDNVVNVKLIRNKIRSHFKSSSADVQVLPFTDGSVALDEHVTLRNAQADPDAPVLAGIFIDFFMPKLDGINWTKKVRLLEAEKGWPRIPIYGCSANATTKRCAIFKGAGGDDVLGKPWNPGQMASSCNTMVANLLGAERQESAGGNA